VTGTLYASQKVEIHATGKFYGDIHAPALIIEEGAIFEGKCEMASGAAQASPASVAEIADHAVDAAKARSA
jgi:cytoskeletal protein CcmA (bactofilin family)